MALGVIPEARRRGVDALLFREMLAALRCRGHRWVEAGWILGGVKIEHCRPLAARGATTLVAGSAIFGAADPAVEIRRMRAAAQGAVAL